MTAVLARRHEPHPSSPLPRKPPDFPHDPPLPPHAPITSSPQKSIDLPPPQPSKRRSQRALTKRDALHASLCALAIMSALMLYSLLQERIMTRPYTSPNTSRTAFFPHSLFLVLANRLLAATMAAVAILLRRERAHLQPVAPVAEYISVSISNVVATSCQYEALKWLTFPTVTIGKCAKMLPVMLIQKFRSGRHYAFDDFAVVAVVLAGCATMISSGNVSANHPSAAADTDTPVGFLLMLLYLLFDAVTSTQQESLFDRYNMSVYNQMLYINLASACISVFALTLSAALPHCLTFLTRFPSILPDIAMLSLSAVAGQFAITYTIHMYGALLYAAVMTTRQFCSVLASDIIFKHGLTVLQWTGALMVFSALFFKLWRKAMRTTE